MPRAGGRPASARVPGRPSPASPVVGCSALRTASPPARQPSATLSRSDCQPASERASERRNERTRGRAGERAAREEERAASHIPAHQPGGGEGAPPRRALGRCPAKAGGRAGAGRRGLRAARPGTRLPSARPGSPLKPPSAVLGPPFTSGSWERPPLRRPRLSEEGDSGEGALRRLWAVLAPGRTWAGQAVPAPSSWFLLLATSKEGLPASPLRGGQKFCGPVQDLAAGPQALRHGRLAPLGPFERPKPGDPGATGLPCPAGA